MGHCRRICAAAVLLAGAAFFWAGPIAAQQPSAKLDLAAYIDLGEYYVKPFAARKDSKSGFLIGGKNDTALIKTLKEINGRKIADLEHDMRPAAKTETGVGSKLGFLGKDEALLDIFVADNQFIVDDLKLSHQELAQHLHALGTIALWQRKHKQEEAEFVYRGRRFKVKSQIARGFQLSPFLDDTKTNVFIEVHNLDSGKDVGYSLLVPYMIERYGFYEGKGTPYRLDPRKVRDVFDFLQPKGKRG